MRNAEEVRAFADAATRDQIRWAGARTANTCEGLFRQIQHGVMLKESHLYQLMEAAWRDGFEAGVTDEQRNGTPLGRLIWALMCRMGAKCEKCGSHNDLEFHHPFGRNWNPATMSQWSRVRMYEKDFEAGRLVLWCAKCNGRDGNVKSRKYSRYKARYVPGKGFEPIP